MALGLIPYLTIEEQLQVNNMSTKEFQKKMGLSNKKFEMLQNGELRIDHKIARKLERVLKIPEYFWINLDMYYRKGRC